MPEPGTEQARMKLSEKMRVPEDVLAKVVGDETVMLDLANGTYFGLDPVGTRVWELLGDGKTLAEVCAIMMNEFDVSRQVLENDVLRLAEDLASRGLIVPA